MVENPPIDPNRQSRLSQGNLNPLNAEGIQPPPGLEPADRGEHLDLSDDVVADQLKSRPSRVMEGLKKIVGSISLRHVLWGATFAGATGIVVLAFIPGPHTALTVLALGLLLGGFCLSVGYEMGKRANKIDLTRDIDLIASAPGLAYTAVRNVLDSEKVQEAKDLLGEVIGGAMDRCSALVDRVRGR